ALQTMLDPAQCGPAFIALPQDVHGASWDVPAEFLAPVVHETARPRPDRDQVHRAVEAIRASRRPLLVAGGGVRYSAAEAALSSFADRHRIPVVETMAGRSTLLAEDPAWAGPLGITGWDAANRLAGEADLVLAVGTRLQDFTTASWTLFGPGGVPLIGINVAGFDAIKHASQVVVGDALACLEELGAALGEWAAPASWQERAASGRRQALSLVAERTAPGSGVPTYAQVVGAVNRAAGPDDLVLTAAGGLPGELNGNWLARGVGTFDCEYGFSCMGYEISGAWGAAMARRAGDVFCLVGDGSYLMLNSDLLSSVLSGHPMIVVVCDNGGFAVIDRLQRAQGGESFATMLEGSRGPGVASARVDFAAHAQALGCDAVEVATIPELQEAIAGARSPKRTTVLVLRTDPEAWTESEAFWEVGIPEQSDRSEVRAAEERLREGRLRQWKG
ncbi:MAG: thiamine pyrophosphate-dependent enzyme, partial [Candidatus Dormibacteraceae bacterium]